MAGIKQQELAKYLRVSQSFVNQCLNDDRPWPSAIRTRAETFVRKRLAVIRRKDLAQLGT